MLQRTAAGVWGPWVEIWRGRGSPCVRETEAEKAKESDGAAGNPRPTELQTEPYLPQEGMPGQVVGHRALAPMLWGGSGAKAEARAGSGEEA